MNVDSRDRITKSNQNPIEYKKELNWNIIYIFSPLMFIQWEWEKRMIDKDDSTNDDVVDCINEIDWQWNIKYVEESFF
jgi:hypothetical protein